MATKVNTHPPMLDELLTQINGSPSVIQSIKDSLAIPYFQYYIELAVSPDWTTLDISEVTFKQYEYHRSMAGSLLLNRQTVNIMSNVIMKKDIPDRTKAIQFKALSEMLYVDESIALSAILVKNLDSIYPNITFSAINEALYGKIEE